MTRYLIHLLFIVGCSNSSSNKAGVYNQTDTVTDRISESSYDTAGLRHYLNSADSVVLASHYSPNEPIKNERTGKYLPSFKVIENGKLNESIVQERKKLGREEIEELGDILSLIAVPDTVSATCFQPRHGIFVYKSGSLLFMDICFDCHAVATSHNWGSDILFDSNKYETLLAFYKNQRFKYML